jgi:hypothetical protein
LTSVDKPNPNQQTYNNQCNTSKFFFHVNHSFISYGTHNLDINY